MEKVRTLALAAPTPAADAATAPSAANVLLGLSPAEQLTVTAIADGGTLHVQQRATALADRAQGADVRCRSIARAVAVAEAQAQQFVALHSLAVAKGDAAGAALAGRAATGAVRRLTLLFEQHRAEEQRGNRSVVVVGQVNIEAAR